ncbi:uncharacterized protein [Aristolochia californica]|uniref:uncharacterized protein isoform X2 n=1 Tax=Aristolochia californica TaxID=171875 RepID=UPI0035E1A41E
MAFSATFYVSPSSRLFSCSSRLPSFHIRKTLTVRALSSSLGIPYVAVRQKSKVPSKTGSWQWRYQDNSVNVYYEEYEAETPINNKIKNVLMIPTISDVSTVEEWRTVAQDIAMRNGEVNWQTTIVDWPGNDVVVIAGGHAATIALRAAKKGLVKPSALAAVAPTWAGPLPIVFGRNSDMETRYGLLRGALRTPAVGWMMYNVLVSNEKAIQSQYKSHVYADPQNVTPSIIENRYALTKRKGARFVPAAFLTGLLDPVKSREEFLDLFASMDEKVPILVVSTSGAPKRSKAEMEALRGAKGVSKFVEVPGALLPQEEYPEIVAEELYKFLQEIPF